MSGGWFDELPDGWTVAPLKASFKLVQRPPREGDGVVTAFRDGQVTLRSNRRMDGFTEAEKEIGYQGIRKGDLVIHQMDAFAGAIGVSDSDGKATPVYSACVPLGQSSPSFFAYLLRHMSTTGWMTAIARGIRERSTDFRWASAKDVLLPTPTPLLQRSIAHYLDVETTEIDAFIADQEQLVTLLAERRAAVIAEAVIRGLDRSVPMQDSGVDWLGQVPDHWHIGRISHAYRLTLGKMVNAGAAAGEMTPYVRAGSIQPWGLDLTEVKQMPASSTERRALSLRAGDVVVVEGGAGYGRSDVLKEDLRGWIFQNHVIRARPTQRQTGGFLDYWVKSLLAIGHFEALSGYATIPNVSAEKLGGIEFAFPPGIEQEQIVDYLDRETSEIDAAIADAREAIALSRERRAALISVAVTGQVDVTGRVEASV